jgi:cyclic beta-1,2-glucan synthetase
MYQGGVEWILGFRLRGTTLFIDPCIPRAWPGYEIDFRYHSAKYQIVVENPQGVSRGVASMELDGQALPGGGAALAGGGVTIPGGGAAVPLVDDGGTHHVRVVLGQA